MVVKNTVLLFGKLLNVAFTALAQLFEPLFHRNWEEGPKTIFDFWPADFVKIL